MVKVMPFTGGELREPGISGGARPAARHLGLHPLGRLCGEPAGEDVVSTSGLVTKM